MPAVARMDPERAHLAAVWAASKGLVPRDRSRDPDILVGRCMVCQFIYQGLQIADPLPRPFYIERLDLGARTGIKLS